MLVFVFFVGALQICRGRSGVCPFALCKVFAWRKVLGWCTVETVSLWQANRTGREMTS